MSTCMREGYTYHRHRFNEGGVCKLCDHKSLRALNQEARYARETSPDQSEARAIESFENEGGGVSTNSPIR